MRLYREPFPRRGEILAKIANFWLSTLFQTPIQGVTLQIL